MELELGLHFAEVALEADLAAAAAAVGIDLVVVVVEVDLEVVAVEIDLAAVPGIGLEGVLGTVLDPADILVGSLAAVDLVDSLVAVDLVDSLVVVDLVDSLVEVDLEDSTVVGPDTEEPAGGTPGFEHKLGLADVVRPE